MIRGAVIVIGNVFCGVFFEGGLSVVVNMVK